jgi:hypothetical protein
MADKTPYVIVLGVVFGGLTFCRHFQNPNNLRRLTFDLPKREKPTRSIKGKQLNARWNYACLLHLLEI